MSFETAKRSIKAVLHSRFLLSLREAFIALIPYFVSSAIAILLLNSAVKFNIVAPSDHAYSVILASASLVLSLFPVIVSISIGFFISKNFGQSGVVGAMLALLCFSLHGQYINFDGESFRLDPTGGTPYAVIIPCLSSLILKLLVNLHPNLDKYFHHISRFLSEKLLIILPFTLTFFSFYTFMPVINFAGDLIASLITPDISQSTIAELTFERMLFTHGLWFLGIHGDNTFNMVFDANYLMQPIIGNLPAKTFYDTFVLIGGTGCFAGLIIAALFLKSGSHEKNIAKLSIPFTAFNFCEIILFALPIFLNPIMLIPFVMAPTVNFLISYTVIDYGLVNVSNETISWMTPTLVNGFMVSQGFSGVLLQLFLLCLNTLVYYPFLKWHSEQINFDKAISKLSDQLNISEQLRNKGESDFIAHQIDLEKANKALKEVLTEISNGRLLLYYQPQICQFSKTVSGFEALLRLEKQSGDIVGPYFLDTLIKHDETEIIDMWVIEQAHRDLVYFNSKEFKPVISINVNPKVMSNSLLVEYICEVFKDFPSQLKIEIVESSYLTDKKTVLKNIKSLQNAKIHTVIDDFGTGYSSLAMLSELPIKYIKLDKSLLDDTGTVKGKEFYQHIVELLHKMDKSIVAEGVETQEQLAFINDLKIEVVQGWVYQKALPKKDVINFVKRF
ncbi:EAL domain-containing protein [Pseudoalteromonas sp. SS15]|uniref:EAL domain-containing protein n=1 Tax=Pseudoalteromonas sp. SS15 TaxID=3139393 RepID=UPI003BAACF73